MRRPFAAPLLLLVACASTGGARWAAPAAGEPVRVSLRDYKSGEILSIVNESHTSRLELYSQERADARTKVQSDEVVDALLEYFEQEGLGTLMQPGQALPAAGVTKSIEVTAGGETFHALRRTDMETAGAQAFLDCMTGFLALYAETYALQAVEGEAGEQFRAPRASRKKGD